MARLAADLASGRTTLAHDSLLGYLPALLAALEIPSSSQVLVFSRTSMQTDRIAPWAPRALYFNDDVYVGYVQDSPILELGAVDPARGGVFYTFRQAPRARPTPDRETTACLMCHQSRAVTRGVAGFMVLSTLADRLGYPITGVHDGVTTDATPRAVRYGGYYITGAPPGPSHAGNIHAPLLGHEVGSKPAYRAGFDYAPGRRLETLAAAFDTTRYLTGRSDYVALSVLTHQTVVHNLITVLQEATAEAVRDGSLASAADSLGTPLPPRVGGAVETLLRALFFSREPPWPASEAASPPSPFVTAFERRGPFDSQGRSLRQVDRSRRLFRYPLSFLVYSDSFRALPPVARDALEARMRDVLAGRETSPSFEHLTPTDRLAIREILQVTHPDFAPRR